MHQASKFDGGLLSYILNCLAAFFITAFSLGILAPWGICIMYKWEVEHTIIEGRRLGFNGTAMGLFGQWIKWFILIIITFGIYGFWVNIKVKQWITKHTYFQD